MKHRAIWFLVACLLPLAAQAEYFRPLEGGYSRYKLEAIRQLITPDMRIQAAILTKEPRLQEVVEMSMALDRFVFDGMRLVRTRGILLSEGAIDEISIGRTMSYYGVDRDEAHAWLLASRALAMTGFVPGRSLSVMEVDMSATAADLRLRLETYFPRQIVNELMPHFVVAEPIVKEEVRSLIPVDFKIKQTVAHQFDPAHVMVAAVEEPKDVAVVEAIAPEVKVLSPKVVKETMPQPQAPMIEKKPHFELPPIDLGIFD